MKRADIPLNRQQAAEFRQIRLGIESKLMRVGETNLAKDIHRCHEDCTLETMETSMRSLLKGLGPDCMPENARVLAASIVDVQLLRGKLEGGNKFCPKLRD